MLNSLQGFSKYIKARRVITTTLNFKLICNFNLAFFLCLVAIFSAKSYFGEPIDCNTDGKTIKSQIDSFCWLIGVYIQKGFTGALTADTAKKGWGMVDPNSPKHYLRYYQWMVFIYFFMAISYACPSYFWKRMEGGLMEGLCHEFSK